LLGKRRGPSTELNEEKIRGSISAKPMSGLEALDFKIAWHREVIKN